MMNSLFEDISSLVRGQILTLLLGCFGFGPVTPTCPGLCKLRKMPTLHCSKNQDQVYYVLITCSHYHLNKYKVQVPEPRQQTNEYFKRGLK